jgi:DNA-binding beta-propeller fold protein YncE
VYVADTYNSAIRLINTESGEVTTVIGNPQAKSMCRFDDPNCDTLGLYEPSDVKIIGNRLFVVDTNNHLVRVFGTDTGLLKTLDVK